MRVLVTGSMGFIGAALMKELADTMTVAGLDRREVPALRGKAQYTCDILDPTRLCEVVRDFAPDAIVHLAARTDLDEKRDIRGYAANTEGVNNLLNAIRATPSVRRCIWTSSQLVCRVGYVPRDALEYTPDTLYGASKVQTEVIVRENDGAGCEWCLVRPTTVWGPGMSPHYQRLLTLIKKRRYFHVGRKPLWKSYSYVGNITYQYRRLLKAGKDQVHGRTLYLADYEPIDLIAWCNSLQRALNAKPIPTLPPHLAAMIARAGDLLTAAGIQNIPLNSFRLKNILTEYCFDTAAIRAICGPLPYTVEQGVTETVAWFNAYHSA
jgi:GlcNAc-P-P-Und epimerase